MFTHGCVRGRSTSPYIELDEPFIPVYPISSAATRSDIYIPPWHPDEICSSFLRDEFLVDIYITVYIEIDFHTPTLHILTNHEGNQYPRLARRPRRLCGSTKRRLGPMRRDRLERLDQLCLGILLQAHQRMFVSPPSCLQTFNLQSETNTSPSLTRLLPMRTRQ